MAFNTSYRAEKVYFEKLRDSMVIMKDFLQSEANEKIRYLIENGIDDNGAILLLYRNVGEAWSELLTLLTKLEEKVDANKKEQDKYNEELNEKIDQVNNYLMALIRDLQRRMDIVEADLAQMGRLFTYDLNRVNDDYTLSESGDPVTFESTKELFTHVRPHLVPVRGTINGEVTYLFPRKYDLDEESGVFEWYTFGFVGNEIQEITVTLLPDDSVNVAIESTNFASILQRITTLETRATALEGRMSTAEDDIDALEQTAESHNTRITTLEECCEDVQDALDGKQDKLTAGSGISIDPVTNEITNTAQGATYTAGEGIAISQNNEISNTDIETLAYSRRTYFETGTVFNFGPLHPGEKIIKGFSHDFSSAFTTAILRGARFVGLTITKPSQDESYQGAADEEAFFKFKINISLETSKSTPMLTNNVLIKRELDIIYRVFSYYSESHGENRRTSEIIYPSYIVTGSDEPYLVIPLDSINNDNRYVINAHFDFAVEGENTLTNNISGSYSTISLRPAYFTK